MSENPPIGKVKLGKRAPEVQPFGANWSRASAGDNFKRGCVLRSRGFGLEQRYTGASLGDDGTIAPISGRGFALGASKRAGPG